MEEPPRESERPSERTIILKESQAAGGPVYVWDEDEISIYALLRPLVQYWSTIALVMVVFAAAAVAYSLTRPPTYTSTAKFYPETEGATRLSSLSGVAAQFGFDIGGQEPGKSPQFYADLLETEQILQSAVTTSYTIDDSLAEEGQPTRGDLVEILQTEGETPEIRREKARSLLEEEILDVETDSETGVITATVSTPWPDLSAAIGSRMLELLEAFNLESRRSKAAMEREFIEEQLEESQRDLELAEGSLQRFLEQTRRVATSPSVVFERDRLRRQVDLRQQLYTSLSEAYQRARIEEVRDIPAITVIDRPSVPARPDDRRVLLNLALGTVFGAMIGTGIAYGRSFMRRSEERTDEEYEELVREFRHAFEGPRNALRRIREALPGTSGETEG